MSKSIWKIACTGIIFFGALFNSCKNNGFSGFDYWVEPHTRTGMIDTVTIKVSNLIVSDSIVSLAGKYSDGPKIGFTGNYFDTEIGVIQTQTYLEFARTSEGVSEADRWNSRFDSVTLVLRPNGNYYGDTIKHAAFKVSRILKPIEKHDDGNLYSTSTVPLGAVLTDTAFRIKVKDIPNNEFEVKLPKSFGEWLFQGIAKDDEAFKINDFLKTFPGLSIEAGTGSSCIHGLNVSDTACMIRLYYHVNTTSKEDRIMDFKVNPLNSFYHLKSDKEKLPPYHSKSDPVPSSQTNNKGVIMAGFPMYTRLEFPYLNELRWLGGGGLVKIQKATLYVRPIQRSFDTIPLPPKLNIFYFDPQSNTPLSDAIKPPSMGGNQNTGPQDGSLPEKYQYLQNPNFPQYTFDVTDFIASQIGKEGYLKWALSLLIPNDSRENTLQRLVFGNQNYWYKNEMQSRDNRIKLEIIYVVYND